VFGRSHGRPCPLQPIQNAVSRHPAAEGRFPLLRGPPILPKVPRRTYPRTINEQSSAATAPDPPRPSLHRQPPPHRRRVGSSVSAAKNTQPTTAAPRYALLQIFSKFGKVTKLDYLFHKTGALKGKPRGYAFVEYGNKDVRSSSVPPLHNLITRASFLFFYLNVELEP
jgi:hypothetical protein